MRDIRRTERHDYEPREGWAKGAWDDEPDLVEWRNDEQRGLALLVVRGPMGAWCGYVGLPPGHAFHGADTDAAEGAGLDVHGGITFAGGCHGRICHVPAPGEPEVWWLGFDCSHAWDLSPGLAARLDLTGRVPAAYRELGGTYHTLESVMAETERLAAQLSS